jgi:hypothetical protein
MCHNLPSHLKKCAAARHTIRFAVSNKPARRAGVAVAVEVVVEVTGTAALGEMVCAGGPAGPSRWKLAPAAGGLAAGRLRPRPEAAVDGRGLFLRGLRLTEAAQAAASATTSAEVAGSEGRSGGASRGGDDRGLLAVLVCSRGADSRRALGLSTPDAVRPEALSKFPSMSSMLSSSFSQAERMWSSSAASPRGNPTRPSSSGSSYDAGAPRLGIRSPRGRLTSTTAPGRAVVAGSSCAWSCACCSTSASSALRSSASSCSSPASCGAHEPAPEPAAELAAAAASPTSARRAAAPAARPASRS